jgi:site-specific DNA-methyltransferase (adenine-specific)
MLISEQQYNNLPEELKQYFNSEIAGINEDYRKAFYCPKVSRAERHMGHEMPPAMFGQMEGCYDENGQRYAVELDRREGNVGNNHPTVKPVELMKYLIKLVTPPNGKVLDPFNGSGSTGMAAVELGYEYVGIEQDEKYCEISRKRIAAHFQKADPLRASGLFES